MLWLLDGNPDGLAAVLGLDDLHLEFVEPLATIENFADFAVLTYEDAALRILGGVARMDADALPFAVELGAAKQDGKPLLELRTPRDHHSITAFGNGRATFHLVGTVGIVAPSWFEGVAEILLGCTC